MRIDNYVFLNDDSHDLFFYEQTENMLKATLYLLLKPKSLRIAE